MSNIAVSEFIRQRKQQLDGDTLVAGSTQLVQTLIELRIVEARQVGDDVLVIARPATRPTS